MSIFELVTLAIAGIVVISLLAILVVGFVEVNRRISAEGQLEQEELQRAVYEEPKRKRGRPRKNPVG